MDAQTKAFQALKPVCVALGESAKGLSEGKVRAAAVTDNLGRLKQTLSSHTSKPGALHPKLAEYVFFPISQVLRVSQKATIQCLELCLQCISILIDQGWRNHLPGQTAAQLVILCTLLAEKKPQGLPFAETTEELQSSAFWCLYHIFRAAGENQDTKRLLTTETHFPQLGKTISVLLDAIEDGSRSMSQVAASTALEALMMHVADREIHASFLPGIMSKLTKAITPSTKARPSPQVLMQCLNVVKILLESTLGEQNDSSSQRPDVRSSNGQKASTIVTHDWKVNAAAQLKPALSNMMKLRRHGNEGVKATLGRLCLAILRACRKTLSACSSIALDTLIVLVASDRDSSLEIEFEMLLQADASVGSSLQSLLYEGLQSMPTVLQGADEQAKTDKLRQITTTYQILAKSGRDMAEIDRVLAIILRDSVVITLTAPGVHQQPALSPTPLQSLDLAISSGQNNPTAFESPLIKYRGQHEIMQAIESLASAVVDNGLSAELRSGLARALHQSGGDAQVASFWLLLLATEKEFVRSNESEALLDLGDERAVSPIEELEELYSFALVVLTRQPDEPQDPRLQALALQALALRARFEGKDFRFELLDALYPILHTMATPDGMLQRASITALDILSSACGYGSVKELIVDNVDYLTNAVALKLNAFDVSPQAPQVLLMMLRLAGPSLLPYLEDTVESIFAALEDYHGYPVLVELLFRVLGVMAEEGVKAPQLTIEGGLSATHQDASNDKWAPTTVEGLAMQLRLRAQDEQKAMRLQADDKEPHPKRSWSDKPQSKVDDDIDDLLGDEQEQPVDTAEAGTPASKTYSLLLKVTELTQHFLPSASPSLRTSLLGLIRTTAPALAKHENSFLPLINTLWPEVVSRLDDEEAHIVATALEIVRVLCECAGDFMRSRVVQLWPRIVEIHRSCARDIVQSEMGSDQSQTSSRSGRTPSAPSDNRLKQALTRMQMAPTAFGDTSARQLWAALLSLIPALVKHVHMPPEYFDEALGMVAPVLGQQSVRSAFEEENADAVWLARLKAGSVEVPPPPKMPMERSWRFAAAAG